MKKSVAIITTAIVSVLLVVAICTGLFFGLRAMKDFNEKLHDLLNGTQLANDEFTGFAINSASQTGGDKELQSAADTRQSAEKVTSTLLAVGENSTAEEVQFNDIIVGKTRAITQKDINKYGTITQIAVMNNILFIEITAPNAVNSVDIKEDNYFTLSSSSAVFAVDLESRKVSSVMDACLDAGIYEATETMYFGIKYGLFFSTPDIVSMRQETYLIQLQDGIFKIVKVADTPNGEYVQDKYKNIYLFDSENINPKDYDLNLVTLFTFDNKIYDYFLSTDKRIFRAFKYDRGVNGSYLAVESLQANGRWAQETSSSDKILRGQLTYSDAFQGGEWMLKEGKIIRIAYNHGRSMACYNVDGKLIVHLKNSNEEVILYIGDQDQITPDWQCIEFDTSNYAGCEKIASFETESSTFKYWISISGTTPILKEYNEDNSFQKYEIAARDGKIEITEINPTYCGVEISE